MEDAQGYCTDKYSTLCLFLAKQPNAGRGHIMLEISRSHTITHHSRKDSSGRGIGLSRIPLPDDTQLSQETNIYAPSGIRTRNPNKRAVVNSCLRPLGHKCSSVISIYFGDRVTRHYQPVCRVSDFHEIVYRCSARSLSTKRVFCENHVSVSYAFD